MAGLIQRAVAALYVSDTDTSRVRDNIVTALNPVLTFLTTNFGQNDTVLRILKPLEGLASTWRGMMTIYGNATVMGAMTIDPVNGGDAFIITSVDGKTQVFKVTDNGSTVINGVVLMRSNATVAGSLNVVGPLTGSSGTFSGTVSANSVVSAQGFCDTVFAGTYWSSSYTANNLVPLNYAVNNLGGLGGVGVTPAVRKVPRACSIVGYSLTQAGTNTGTNTLMFYKNNAFLFSWAAGAGANNATFWGTQNKGTYTFLPGDTFSVSYASNAAGNTQVQAYVTFEMSA